MTFIINFIKRILHIIPFLHFYGKWEDLDKPGSYGHFHQIRRCTVCNRSQRRWEDSSGFL